MKKIKTGDTIIVISGDEKGNKGKVLSVVGNRVIVEGINKMKKYVKKNAMGKNQEGTMVEIERPFAISNVQVIDPKTGKGTKVGFVFKDGKKLRIAKKSKEEIVTVALETEKAPKGTKALKQENTKEQKQEGARAVKQESTRAQKDESRKAPKKVVKKKVVKSTPTKNETA